jgi:hypothetical protein
MSPKTLASNLTALRSSLEESTLEVDGLRRDLDAAVKKRDRIALDYRRLLRDSSRQLPLFQEEASDNVGVPARAVSRS